MSYRLLAHSIVLNGHGSGLESLINEFDDLTEEFAKRAGRARVRRFMDTSKDRDDLTRFQRKIDAATNALQVCTFCRALLVTNLL